MSVDVWADSVQTAALIFAAGAAIFAFRQLGVSRHGGGGANVMQLWELVGSEDARDRRRQLYAAVNRAGPFDGLAENWTQDEIYAAEHVCQLWPVAGGLVRHDLLPRNVVIDEWGAQILRTWRIARPLVEWQRQQWDIPGRWRNYEWLAEQAARDFR